MVLIVFLYVTAISLIFAGAEILLWKKELKVSDRLTAFIFLGSIISAIKSLTTKPVFYKTAKYKKPIGLAFIILGVALYFVALSNSKYFVGF